MASVIILNQKKNSRDPYKFFEVIDKYIESQDFVILDNDPKTYFIVKNAPPNKIKEYVNMIKHTNGYKDVVQSIYYAPSLIKA